MNKVYLVWDNNTDEIVSVHATMTGAREALVEHLKSDCGYTPDDWEGFADDQGYETVEEFQQDMLRMNDYDEDMQMMIEEKEVLD